MNTEKGFTLIELVVAVALIAISALAFLTFSLSGIKNRTDMQRQITAQAMAVDIADRLQRLPSSNSLITPDGATPIRVGYAPAGGQLLQCVGSSPVDNLSAGAFGLTSLTNPVSATELYLYDRNTGPTTPIITAAANANIHHPNANDIANWAAVSETVAPIRVFGGTTFYAVWTVAYLPCAAVTTDLAKIFITVYWIEPEPEDALPSSVASKISSGQYRIKSLSVTADKAYKIETKAGGS